jgi:bacterioferritin-associated ferredoxin
MKNPMHNGHAVYKNSNGMDLHLYIDIDLKTDLIQDFFCKGLLLSEYESEILVLKSLVLNKKIADALALKRSDLKEEVLLVNGEKSLSSLSLTLLHNAIEDYLGTATTLTEQNDLLCLCYGVGSGELKKQILARHDYDVSKLIAETMATSACGSCRKLISESIISIREEHGLIFGLDHSQSTLDKGGRWITIKGLYPAELVLKLDALLKIWVLREEVNTQFAIQIVKIEGYHLWLTVKVLATGEDEESERAIKILAALSDYWRSEIGALFFLHHFTL